MSQPLARILTGYGINSDRELAQAFQMAGARTERVHTSDFITQKVRLDEADLVGIPGGFSFGDHISAGKVMAGKLLSQMGEQLQRVVEKKIPIIGICNGFQVLIKTGILPGGKFSSLGDQTATLTGNDSGRFEDRWCQVEVDKSSPCIWTKNLDRLELPIRHGEGKFFCEEEQLKKLKHSNLICLRYSSPTGEKPSYPANPNGSLDDAAGICDETGTVFGLMPHPEAYIHATNHPDWNSLGLRGEGGGVALFRNAVQHVQTGLL